MSLRDLADTLLLPPGVSVGLGALGLLLWPPLPRLGAVMVAFAIGLLYFTSTPWLATQLGGILETAPPLSHDQARNSGAGAIVVLGSGAGISAPGEAAVLPTALELERLRLAAELHRVAELPVLTSGDGRGRGGEKRMAGTLRDDLGVDLVWSESNSRDTLDNAHNSAGRLRAEGIERVILVTHASHMRRAARAFAASGLEVVPAPAGFRVPRSGLSAWLPDAAALHYVAAALHELAGDLWYQIRGAYASTGPEVGSL